MPALRPSQRSVKAAAKYEYPHEVYDGIPSEELFRISVKQYHEMTRCGIFDEDSSVELLEGIVFKKWPDHENDNLWRFTVDQYHEMILAGILGPADPVELLEGVLIRKMPKHPPHCTAGLLLWNALHAM